MALTFCACGSTTDTCDLRTNPSLYARTAYETRVLVDTAAFLAPLVDERVPIVEAAGPYPRKYVDESVWDRPMLEMIEDIIADELRDSGVFTSVVRSKPAAETLIVTPYLRRAICGEEEQPTGRRSLAEIEIRFVVHGPGADADAREIVFDRTFQEVAQTPVKMRPPQSTTLIGIILNKALRKALEALDQSNISRSAIPSDPSITGRG